ncbi:MAG: Rrf2 family transcriptional regulator [Actinobacteria bacterium]|nr:Rrf2 family transcriptional regulator [Actinomycetota bacterium]
MKLSTRSRYGTRLVFELALKFNQGPVYLKDISSSQEISLKYLGQLIIPLKIAGIIKSSRGAHGGYYLAKSPEKIKLIEIVEALEGPFYFVECLENPDICSRYDKCITRTYWNEINQLFVKTLNGVTLQDMIYKYEVMNEPVK